LECWFLYRHHFWRVAKPGIHRLKGKRYNAFAVLSAISCVYIGFYATAGVVSAMGFVLLGFIWLLVRLSVFNQAKEEILKFTKN
jgi:hypothetical protein